VHLAVYSSIVNSQLVSHYKQPPHQSFAVVMSRLWKVCHYTQHPCTNVASKPITVHCLLCITVWSSGIQCSQLHVI